MKKKEMERVTKSVEKAVKRFLKHTEFYEYADDMVVGVYSTPEGVLVRMKQGSYNLTTMPESPLPELGLSGYDLLGLTTKTTSRVVVKEHGIDHGKKLSTNFYDIAHQGDRKKEEESKEVPLYTNMQKELIEDIEDSPEKSSTGGVVVTESDLNEEIETYLDTFFKGTTKKISEMDLSELPGLLMGGTMDTIAKLIMQDYEDHGILYDKSAVKDPAKFGLYEILVAMAYRSNTLKNQVAEMAKQVSDNIQMGVETTETLKQQQDEVFELKRENAKLKDQLGNLQKKLDDVDHAADKTLNAIADVTTKVTSEEFLRMNSFKAYITTVIGKAGSFITLSDLMRFTQGVLKEEDKKFPFVASLKKQGLSRRDYELLRDDKLDKDSFKLKQLKAVLSLYADGNPETILHMQNILWKAPFRVYKSATEDATHEALNELRGITIKGQDVVHPETKNSQVLSEA